MSDSLVTPGTVACQAPLSIGCARQEYWNQHLLHWQVDSLPLSPQGKESFKTLPVYSFPQEQQAKRLITLVMKTNLPQV